MDKQIRKIEKENRKEGKDLKKLEHMDKKRDKVCAMGEKMMKKKNTVGGKHWTRYQVHLLRSI